MGRRRRKPGADGGDVTGKAYKLEDVQYVVGSRWKQRYLVKNEETGNLQFMNMQFNRLTGKWEKYGQKNDWNTQCANPFDKEYAGDLKGLFKVDEHAKANGYYDEAKHHQQYQGFIQSSHYKKGVMSCITCHSPHGGKGS